MAFQEQTHSLTFTVTVQRVRASCESVRGQIVEPCPKTLEFIHSKTSVQRASITMGHVGSSKDGAKMKDIEEDDDIDMEALLPTNAEILEELGENTVRNFCKKASSKFFEEYGLVSHQINSYNQFLSNGLQNTFDSFGDLTVTPGFDPSKKGDSEHYRYASVKFGKVTLDPPKFWCGEGNTQEFKMLPRHARLQRMTYSSKMKVSVNVEVRYCFPSHLIIHVPNVLTQPFIHD